MKKAITQKILSLFLAFCIVSTLIPMNAFAAGANDIVSIAVGEVGNSGRPNKYTRWCGSINGSYSYAWCASFVGWCASQAGESAAVPRTASVENLYNGIIRAGGDIVSAPQAGDIVIYRRRSDGYYAHIGIMENSSTSIHGNYGNAVRRGFNPTDYSYSGASVKNGQIEVIYLRPKYRNQADMKIEYFDCDVQINTTSGKIVNLYDNINDSQRRTYFSRAVTAYSTKGATLSDGSIWYQIQANHQGQIISVWLNAGSNGITVTELNPDTYSMDLSTSSVSLSPGEKQTITIQYNWTKTPPHRIDFKFNREGTATATWGEQSGKSVQLIVTAQDPGTATLDIWLSNAYGKELCKKSVAVNVKQDEQIKRTPLDLGSEFYGYIFNPGLGRYITNDSGNVSSRSYSSSGAQKQIWKFTRQSDGSYFIISQLNGYDSLDVQEFGTNSGTNVRAYPQNGCTAQRWYILGTEEPGKCVLTAVCTQCVLDINGNSSAEGENVQMYEFNGTGAQLFQIIVAPAR